MALAAVATWVALVPSPAQAHHAVTAGPWQRVSNGTHTICGTNELRPTTGTHAFGVSRTTTRTSASCSGSTTAGASVRARGQVLWDNGGWTLCGPVADSGYLSTGTTSVQSFNTLGCGSGEYANSTQHGGWISGTEHPATHWPLVASHDGY
jgi:hypothetical protein